MNGRDNLGYYSNNKSLEAIPMSTKYPEESAPPHDPENNIDDTNRRNRVYDKIMNSLEENRKPIRWGLISLANVIVVAYFAYATYYYMHTESSCTGDCPFGWCDGYGMLMILFILTYLGLIYFFLLKPLIMKTIYDSLVRTGESFIKSIQKLRYITIVIVILIIGGICIFIYFETRDDATRLAALIGPFLFILLGYIFSKDRKAIRWRTVITGIFLQFILGIVCIRWEVGRNVFQCMGDRVARFLNFSEEGSRFVYSKDIVAMHPFAFAILPVIFFFSFCISILYYLGTMQWVIQKLGWILQSALGTTVCESVNAAANIFLGMSETPLLIRPYLPILTHSEIHSIMVSGFATVSGTVLAAYISYGAKPSHLITSSVMAAPASLAFSKLYYPEIEESQTKTDNIKMEKSKDHSLLDAASNGAMAATEIILGIIANLVAFVSFIAFLNAIVNWLGVLVGIDDITFEWLFSKIFMPLSWIIGVEWDDCDIVAKVIATKTIINEFVAYERLGVYIEAGLKPRSSAIATYAICGFANPSSMGILIGTLSSMAPERRSQITSVAFRAFIVGSVVCFTSASFAALMMPQNLIDEITNSTTVATTLSTQII